MKRFTTFLLLFVLTTATNFTNAQNVNIPDANFKAYLVGNPDINLNGDNEIQLSEAEAYTGSIICNSLEIADLTGIESFINITELNCFNNQLTTLDVSNNTALKILICMNNPITALDLNNNPSLTQLWSSFTQITALDLSNNPDLIVLISVYGQLTTLNVQNGNNTNISAGYFQTTDNPNLSCIQVDDVDWSSANWTIIDPTSSFSEDCGNTNSCLFGVELSFTDYTDTATTISWQGSGTYEIEYGLSPYAQGTDGITLPLFITDDQEPVLEISDLTPGKAYDIYVRKICSEDNFSMWKTTKTYTFVSSAVTEYPYFEDFEATENRGVSLITRGWVNINASSANWPWTLLNNNNNGSIFILDMVEGEVNATIYSRPIEFTGGNTYTISLDYELYRFWAYDSDEFLNPPDMTILVNSSLSEEGATAISSVTAISNTESETLFIEFTPETSGIYYLGINGFFAPSPAPGWINGNGFNHLFVDNFRVKEDNLSVNNHAILPNIVIYPNPFNDFVTIKSDDAIIEKIQIYDIKGSLLYKNNINNVEVNIDLSYLNTGIYFIKVSSEQKVKTHKIVKN